MELKEMIKVMQHYANGGEVEFKLNNGWWELASNPCWDWDEFEYRIKEPKQKVTIEKWLLKDDEDNYYVVQTSNIDKFNDDEKVKLIESYEVEI